MEGNIPRKKQNPHLFFERFRAAPRRVYTLVRVYKLTVSVRALEPFILQQDREIIYFFVVWFQNQNIHTPITEKNLTQEPPPPSPTTTTTTASLDFPSLQGTDDSSGTTRSVRVTFKLSRKLIDIGNRVTQFFFCLYTFCCSLRENAHSFA